MAKKLTDRAVAQATPPKKGKPIRFLWDASATGLCLKLTPAPAGRKLWCANMVFPPRTTQSIRTLGRYPSMTLAQARDKAEKWHTLTKQGLDPSVEEQKEIEAKQREAMLAKESSFGSVVEAFAATKLVRQRQGARVRQRIEKEVIPTLGDKPIATITRRDIVDLITKITARTTTGAHARGVLADVRAVYNYAITSDRYGLETSPCDRIKPLEVIGKKNVRERVLNDDELRKLWTVTGQIGYPAGPMARLLLLTGCRVSEVLNARWCEINVVARTFTVPAARYKTGLEHAVPLSDDALALLEALPRGRRGDFVFSVTQGASAAQRSKMMKIVTEAWGAVAAGSLWSFHDLRRTTRTRLSVLGVADHVAELVIGHSRKGVAGVYDRHKYHDEKLAALEAWAKLLRSIVTPTNGDNVVTLRCA